MTKCGTITELEASIPSCRVFQAMPTPPCPEVSRFLPFGEVTLFSLVGSELELGSIRNPIEPLSFVGPCSLCSLAEGSFALRFIEYF